MKLFNEIKEWFESLEPHEDHYLVVVRKGDTLWEFAKDFTGDGSRWTEIRDLNSSMQGQGKEFELQVGDKIAIPENWVH